MIEEHGDHVITSRLLKMQNRENLRRFLQDSILLEQAQPPMELLVIFNTHL